MSAYLGFTPTENEDYYFLSYNNEDADRIGKIACSLIDYLDIWYDHGIEYGERWESQITKKIKDSRAIIMFITKGIFPKESSYVIREYKIAKHYEKKLYIVILDKLTKDDIPDDKVSWWIELEELQNIEISGYDVDKAVSAILGMNMPQNKSTDIEEKKLKSDLLKEEKPGADSVKEADKVNADSIKESEQENVEEGNDSIVISDGEDDDEPIEPEVEIITHPPTGKGLFGRKTYTKDDKSLIRDELLERLETEKNSLGCVISELKSCKKVYREIKIIYRIVDEEMGQYDFWDYNVSQDLDAFLRENEETIRTFLGRAERGESSVSDRGKKKLGDFYTSVDKLIQSLKNHK